MEKTYLDVERLEDHFYAPSILLRLKASVIDAVVIFLLMYCCSLVLEQLAYESAQLNVYLIAMILLYEPLMTSFACTLGQRLMGLRVVNYKTYLSSGREQRINPLFALIRSMSKFFFGWISLITIHSTKHGRALHDIFASTVVISK